MSGGAGNDVIRSRDGAADASAAAPARTTVTADRRDVVAKDCETVRRR